MFQEAIGDIESTKMEIYEAETLGIPTLQVSKMRQYIGLFYVYE